uniref:Uncharacterized protein n=1 Tax=Arundo donax TaxID=35708 RepID=A0A0A9D3H9_ARUDO
MRKTISKNQKLRKTMAGPCCSKGYARIVTAYTIPLHYPLVLKTPNGSRPMKI